MGNLKRSRIEDIKKPLNAEFQEMPFDLDYEIIHPRTIYEAIRADSSPTSRNFRDELISIYRMINARQEIIRGGRGGDIVTYSGIDGQVGSLNVTTRIAPNRDDRSNDRIPTERAIGDFIGNVVTDTTFTQHVTDNVSHITDIERTRWSSMAPMSSLNAHISNIRMHISDEERERLNTRASRQEVLEHFDDENNPHRVTAHQTGSYTFKEVDDLFNALRKSFFNHKNIRWDGMTAELVIYNSINWSPNFVLSYGDDLPDVPHMNETYFSLIPLKDYLVEEGNEIAIYVKRPGSSWSQVGIASMQPGDMVIRYPDTTMLVWMQGRFINIFSHSGEIEQDHHQMWRPEIDDNGMLTFIRSSSQVSPSPIMIRGNDGLTPTIHPVTRNWMIGGVDTGVRSEAIDSPGVPLGGTKYDILLKNSSEDHDTKWSSIIRLLEDVSEGPGLPYGLISWSGIKGKPNWYHELGESTDGFVTQRVVTDEIRRLDDSYNKLRNEYNTSMNEMNGEYGLRTLIINHTNDHTNPHRVTIAQIGAVSLAQHHEHVNNFNNPHGITPTQIGLGNVDNTRDLDKPISRSVQEALDVFDNRIRILGGDVDSKDFIVNSTWDDNTSSIIFERMRGTPLWTKVPIDDVVGSMEFDNDSRAIRVTLPNGHVHSVDLSNAFTPHTGSLESHINVRIEGDNVIRADIVPGSITGNEIQMSVDLRGASTTQSAPVSDRSRRIATTEFVKDIVIDNLISFERDRGLSANMGRILNLRKVDIDDLPFMVRDLFGQIGVIDHLYSHQDTAALSANMGRVLNEIKAPWVHTSPVGDTFGRANQHVFGHVSISSDDPRMNGEANPGTFIGFVSAYDHVHPHDDAKADLDSPNFSGRPTAPNPDAFSNDGQLATTSWTRTMVQNAVMGDLNIDTTTPFTVSVGYTGTTINVFLQGVVLRTNMMFIVNFQHLIQDSDVRLSVNDNTPRFLQINGVNLKALQLPPNFRALIFDDGNVYQILNAPGTRYMETEDETEVVVDDINYDEYDEGNGTEDGTGSGDAVEHFGYVIGGPGISSNVGGRVVSATSMAIIRFKNRKSITPIVSVTGEWFVTDGSGIYRINNINVISVTRSHAIIRFTHQTSLDVGSPLFMIRGFNGTITIAVPGSVGRALTIDNIETFSNSSPGMISSIIGLQNSNFGLQFPGVDVADGRSRVLISLPFKNRKSNIPNITIEGSFMVLFGDNTQATVSNPIVVNVSTAHCMILFESNVFRPGVSMASLIFADNNSRIIITPPGNPTVVDIISEREEFRGSSSNSMTEFFGIATTRNRLPSLEDPNTTDRVIVHIQFKNKRPYSPNILFNGNWGFQSAFGPDIIPVTTMQVLSSSRWSAAVLLHLGSRVPVGSVGNLVFINTATNLEVR